MTFVSLSVCERYKYGSTAAVVLESKVWMHVEFCSIIWVQTITALVSENDHSTLKIIKSCFICKQITSNMFKNNIETFNLIFFNVTCLCIRKLWSLYQNRTQDTFYGYLLRGGAGVAADPS